MEITVHGDPRDPRTDDIVGDISANGQVLSNWGLHLIDVNLAMGNLVDIVGRQAKAWLTAGARTKRASRPTGNAKPSAIAVAIAER